MFTVCRLCLAKDANFVISNGQAAVKILLCTGLEVDPSDTLPQLICQMCRLRLEEFHYFRKRCHAADRRLRHFVRCDLNYDGDDPELSDGDKEDVLLLQDIARCTPTSCSESTAHWRREAAKQIQLELDSYKNELLNLCKQQVREEIEEQVRREVEGMILNEAKQKCELTVLDDLFYEIETWFVSKRNSAVRQHSNGSEGFVSEAADLESVSTGVPPDPISLTEVPTQAGVALLNGPVVKLIDISSKARKIGMSASRSQVNLPEVEIVPPVPTATPMVEINMEIAENGHLREETSGINLLGVTPSPTKPHSPLTKRTRSGYQSKGNTMDRVCRTHNIPIKAKERNCYRCRLRGSIGTNKTN